MFYSFGYNYLNEHLTIHQKIENCITFSLRSDTELSDYKSLNFPITQHENEFREAIVSRTKLLQGLPFSINNETTLADLCLTCAVSYKRTTLAYVKGCPNNFVGWGFNDTAMAAKVIAIGNFVIPLLNASVYHKKHALRSGNLDNKKNEYLQNRKRYEILLNMPISRTFRYNINILDF